jgi:hypothetical protein
MLAILHEMVSNDDRKRRNIEALNCLQNNNLVKGTASLRTDTCCNNLKNSENLNKS